MYFIWETSTELLKISTTYSDTDDSFQEGYRNRSALFQQNLKFRQFWKPRRLFVIFACSCR